MSGLLNDAQALTWERNGETLCIRGSRAFLISGEMHYARAPRELWPELLDRGRECGLNCIASYVFWNCHEPQRDQFDFTAGNDLGHFLDLCAERGLHCIVRMGPYGCAEWNYGGFPAWLRDEPGIVFRTWNKPYMQRVETYFERLCEVIRPRLASRGGPVISCQVENEYANIARRYGADGQRYLAWMAELVCRLGIDVPLIMCEGGAPGALDTVNGFSISDQRLAEFRTAHPGVPILWTEFWTGWYDTWGFQRHRRDVCNMAVHLLRFIARGGSGWNYYMWHAGTNFGRTSMFLQTTRYGFDAPLDEFGRTTPKAVMLGRLHDLLKAKATLIMEGERETRKSDRGEEIVWRNSEGSLTLLLTTDNARLLDADGDLLFDVQEAFDRTRSQIQPPRWQPLLTLDDWQCQVEPRPAQRSDGVTAEHPVEQLTLTRDTSDYCWYSTNIHVDHDAGEICLECPYVGDLLYVYLDDKLVAQTHPPFHENRGTTLPDADTTPANDLELLVQNGFRQTFTVSASPGSHRLDILAVALGLIKGDWQISGSMQTERKGIWQPVSLNGRPLTDWRMHPGLAGESEVPAARWRSLLQDEPVPCTWYKTDFDLDEKWLRKNVDLRLDAAELGKGMLLLNGKMLGRYWLIEGHGYGADQGWQFAELDGLSLDPPGEPTQRYYRLPRAWLQPKNTLLLFEEQSMQPRSLQVQVRVHNQL